MVGLGFTSMMLSNIMSRPSVEKCHRFPDASVFSLDSRCSCVAGVQEGGAVNSTRWLKPNRSFSMPRSGQNHVNGGIRCKWVVSRWLERTLSSLAKSV